jgi:PDZ domain
MRHDGPAGLPASSGLRPAGPQRGAWVALVWLLLAGVLPGCASIVSGSTQSVSVETPGCDGARCELSNDKGVWFVPQTPGTVSIQRSYNNLQVSCARGNVQAVPASFASTTKGMAFGNILFGGIIGAGVDAGTGAAYDYPQRLTVAMACGDAVADAGAAPAAGTRLGLSVAGAADGAPPGLQVLAVQAGSPAARAGLQPGDLIVRADGDALTRPDELARRLAALRAPWSLALAVRRGGVESTVQVVSDAADGHIDSPERKAP